MAGSTVRCAARFSRSAARIAAHRSMTARSAPSAASLTSPFAEHHCAAVASGWMTGRFAPDSTNRSAIWRKLRGKATSCSRCRRPASRLPASRLSAGPNEALATWAFPSLSPTFHQERIVLSPPPRYKLILICDASGRGERFRPDGTFGKAGGRPDFRRWHFARERR